MREREKEGRMEKWSGGKERRKGKERKGKERKGKERKGGKWRSKVTNLINGSSNSTSCSPPS
jgi:hypothetical protein